MRRCREHGWAIAGRYGLYTGWRQTRRDAIAEHVSIVERPWQWCRRRGDRAVKVEMVYSYSAPKDVGP